MTDQPDSDVVGQLEGLGRTALSALQAAELLAVDERSGATQLAVLADGARTYRLPDFLTTTTASVVGEEVALTPWGPGTYVVSSRMFGDGGAELGVLHLLYTARMSPPLADRLTTLVRAFTRHLAIAIENDGLRRRSVQIRATLDTMQVLDDLVTSPTALSDITPRVSEVVAPLVHAESVGITHWDEESRVLHALPGAFGAPVADVASMGGTVTDLRSITARVLATRLPYLSNQAEGDPGILQGYVRLFHLRRLLSLPLLVGDRCVGVLHLANKPFDFEQEDVDLVSRLTPRIATILELATAVRTLDIRQRYEALLGETALSIARGARLDDALPPALREFGSLSESSVVALIGPHEHTLPWSHEETPPDLLERWMSDARREQRGTHEEPPSGPGQPGWAAVHVPIAFHGRSNAALSALRRHGQAYSSYEHTVLERLASLGTLASATERLHEQQQQVARLNERHRIADDLHDRVAQIFFAALLGVDTLLEGRKLDAAERGRLDEVRELLVKGNAFVRDTIAHLTPATTDVETRLRLVVSDVIEDFGVPTAWAPDGAQAAALASLPPKVADSLVRVAREAVVNAAKHANPSSITITTEASDEEVVLEVADDGSGMDGTAEHLAGLGYGMRSMHRAVADAGGTLDFVAGVNGAGTVVHCRWPVAPT